MFLPEIMLVFLVTNTASSGHSIQHNDTTVKPTDRYKREVSVVPRETSLSEEGDGYIKNAHATDASPTSMEFNRTSPLADGRTSPQHVDTIMFRKPTTATVAVIDEGTTHFTANGTESYNVSYTENLFDGTNDRMVGSYLAFTIGMGINRYVLPVIIIVGSIGNLVSMFVMFQRQNRHTSFSIYLGNLAISDNCVLFSAGYYWVVAELQGRTFVDVECKILIWILETFQQNGVLLILSVTLDRLVAVRFPFKATNWCRAKRAKIVSVSVFGVVSVYNIPHLVLNQADKYLVCMLCSFDNMLCVIHLGVTTVITFAIPFVLLLAMNTIIILAVHNSLKYQSNNYSNCNVETHIDNLAKMSEVNIQYIASSASRDCNAATTDQSEDIDTSGQSVASVSQSERGEARRQNQQLSSKDRNVIAMLLLVSFMFLLLNAPRFMRFIIFATVQFEPTPERIALNTLAWHITNKLYFSNNACNFFLYCVSGSKFRRDFKALFYENVYRHCLKKQPIVTEIDVVSQPK